MNSNVDWTRLNDRLNKTIVDWEDQAGLAAAEFDLIHAALDHANDHLKGFQLRYAADWLDIDCTKWSAIEVTLIRNVDNHVFPYCQIIKRDGAREILSFRAGDGRGYSNRMLIGQQSIDYWISVFAELIEVNAPPDPVTRAIAN